MPLESFRSDVLNKKGQTIPSRLVERFIDPAFNSNNTWYEALGSIPHSSKNYLLLVKGESVTPDEKYILLLVYNSQGLLSQQLTFEHTLGVRNTLKGEVAKDASIKVINGSVSFTQPKYVTKELLFKVNFKGYIEPRGRGHREMGLLKEMTRVMRYHNVVREYYECLSRQAYKSIVPYFAAYVSQWLGLKQLSRDKIGQEAHRFLKSKKNVFYHPDFSQAKIDRNTLKVPVELGWDDYQTKVMAYFTFDGYFKIKQLLENAMD